MLKQLVIASVFAGACAPAFAASIDPNNAIALTPDQIQWKKGEANDTAWPIGDPDKPGACLELIKWHPGHFSHPHYHEHARYAVVIDGTWWVSTSNVYDERTTYPVHAGTVSVDVKNTVHWDGCRTGEKEPAVLELVGLGPVKTVSVDENGKPKPGR